MNPIRWLIDDDTIVRSYTREDAEIVYRAVDENRDRLRPFMPWERATRSTSDTLEFIERSLASPNDLEGNGIWVADVFAGSVGLSIDPLMNTGEIGYWIARQFEGRGLVSRACRLFIDHGFRELNLHRIEIHAAVDNRRSRAVAERLGFTGGDVARWIPSLRRDLHRPSGLRAPRARMATRVTRPFEAVVFDLFGTLVPEFSKREFFEAVRAMARVLETDADRFEEAWNVSALDRQTGVFASIEDNVRNICASLDVAPSDAAVAEALDVRMSLYRTWFHPRRGAIETLAEVKGRGYPIALISMCAPDAPAMWRSSALAPYVDVEVLSSEVGLRKPDPAIYRCATAALGVEPAGCLYCGDGAYGELAGAAAVGMTPFLIADPAVDVEDALVPEREEWDGARVSDLRELLPLLPARA